jgi:ParB family chromosome partitioning protein
VFVSIDRDGRLRVDRGYVRPEDNVPEHADDEAIDEDSADTPVSGTVVTVAGDTADEEAEDDALRPLPDRLVTELTAHRTLALRDGLARDPDTAFLAVLHALCLSSFYHYGTETCLEITAKQSGFTAQAPGLADTASAKAVDARHEEWNGRLPESPSALWDVLVSFDRDDRMALFAHCAALTVNVVKEPWNRRTGALAHGDILARAVGLDMAAAGWTATVDAYLGRVPKTRILEAVREAKGEAATQRIDHLKKADMAREAERLLDGTGWLPEPLRPVAPANDTSADVDAAEPEAIAAE